MERLQRIAYYVGIGVVISIFALFLVSALPDIIENSARQWGMLGDAGKSEEALLAMFQKHPAYAAMYERFPDAVEEFVSHENGVGSIEVGAMNFESGSQLKLHLFYHVSSDRVNVNVICMNGALDGPTHIDGLFAEDFIRNTDCLDAADGAGT